MPILGEGLLHRRQEAPVSDPSTELGVFMKFAIGLEQAQPYLFNLAQQVTDAYPQRRWKLLLGDDTSGRLVARFIRKTLAFQDVDLPMDYVCTSQQTRRKVSSRDFTHRLEDISARHGNPDSALFISEKLGSGETATYINGLLQPVFPQIDYAFLASRYDPHPEIGADTLYIGGAGKEAGDTVYRTFESAVKTDPQQAHRNDLKKRLVPEVLKPIVFRHFPIARTSSSYPLNNLDPGVTPVSQLSGDATYRDYARICYGAMDELAAEFDYMRRNRAA